MEGTETSPSQAPISSETIQQYKWPGENDINHVPNQNTLDDVNLEHNCVLDIGRHPDIQPRTHLGTLETLPLEMLANILLHLDIPTLTAFRQVSAKARETVDFLHQYRTVVAQCPDVLRAIVSTRATVFTLDSLYKTLFTEKCSSLYCPLFGAYLHLLTGRRYCFEHFVDPPVVPASRILEVTDSTMEQLKELPHLYSLPGWYSPRPMAYGSEMLIDKRAFDDWANFSHPIADLLLPIMMDTDDWDRMMALPNLVVVSAPFLSGPGPSADWGVGCAVCERSWYGWACTTSGGKFTERGLLEHFMIHGLPVDDGIGGEFHSVYPPNGPYYHQLLWPAENI